MKINLGQIKQIWTKLNPSIKNIFNKAASQFSAAEQSAIKVATNKVKGTKVYKTMKTFDSGFKLAEKYILFQASDEMTKVAYNTPVVGSLLNKGNYALGWITGKTWGSTPGLKLLYNAQMKIMGAIAEAAKAIGIESVATGFEQVKAGYTSGQGGNKMTKDDNKDELNSPAFYSDLGMHTNWTLNAGYPISYGFPEGQTRPRYGVAVVNLGRNPLPHGNAIAQRMNEMYDLLKGIRGLSGVLSYSAEDIYHFNEIAIYAIGEYHRLKQALRVSRSFLLTNTVMPDKVLSELGFEPSDFKSNRANYEQALITIRNFIHSTLPVFGKWPQRWKALYSGFVPDDNDGKICALYLFTCTNNLFYYSGTCATSNPVAFTRLFQKTTISRNSTTKTVSADYQYGNGITTYSTYASNLNVFISTLNTSLTAELAAIKGDIWGAFGSQVVWDDPDYEQCKTALPILSYEGNLIPLTQLRNATYIGGDWSMSGRATSNSTFYQFSNISNHLMPYISYNYGSNINTGTKMFTGDNTSIRKVQQHQTEESTTVNMNVLIPQTQGNIDLIRDITDTGGNIDVGLVDTFGVDIYKYGMSEAQQLECIQLMSSLETGAYTVSSGSTSKIITTYMGYTTHDLFLINLRLLGNTNITVDDTTYYLEGNAISGNIWEIGQAYLQFAYAPTYHITVAHSTNTAGTGYPGLYPSICMNGLDIPALMSRTAYELSIYYAAYSMNALGLTYGDSRLNNLSDAYSSTTDHDTSKKTSKNSTSSRKKSTNTRGRKPSPDH